MKASIKRDKSHSFLQALEPTLLQAVRGGAEKAKSVTYGPVITVKPKG